MQDIANCSEKIINSLTEQNINACVSESFQLPETERFDFQN